MSVLVNKETEYTPSATDVKTYLSAFRIVNCNDKTKARVTGQLKAVIDGTTGEVEKLPAYQFGLTEIQAECSTAEKAAFKTVIAAIERICCAHIPETAGATHDDSDVFV